MKERSTNRKDRRAISVTRSLLEARCLPDEVVGTRWFVFLGWWGRAKVGGLTTCQVLEVPGRGEQGREGGGGIAISLIAVVRLWVISRVVVARGTIIRPAKNLVTIVETRSSTKFQRSPAPFLSINTLPIPSFSSLLSSFLLHLSSKYFYSIIFRSVKIVSFKIPRIEDRKISITYTF